MATASYGVECRECGDRIIAPECSEYAADGVVRHLWRCSRCGCEFETRIVFDPSSPLTPDLVEMFLPSLLVA
jgi:DNA-directed RNA polymerase subunit RPC12/RpoP